MSTVDGVNSLFSDLSIARNQGSADPSQELGQSAFLRLMITQMENQSPLNPQDNSEFVAQLAQFSSVESLDKLNNNFDDFANSYIANQALQASTLVGRSVTVPASETALNPNSLVSVSTELPASSGDVNISIYSEGGQLIDQIPLGQQPSGELVLRWNGQYAELNGRALDWQSSQEGGAAPGIYRFEVSASIDGEQQALDTALSTNVNSVTVDADGTLSLNLAGVGSVRLSDIKQFNE